MAQAENELWNFAKVSEMTGMGRTFIYGEMKAKRFPQRVLVGKSARWKSTEVQAWINAKTPPS